MKKILELLILGILIISTIETIAQQDDIQITDSCLKNNRDFTHKVFAEMATATWCGYCHYAREALDKIYTSGDYPFYYTCMVDDKNIHAAARNNEYNIYGFPTVFFDGGYKVSVGGGTGNEAQYRSYITQTGARTVKDIDIILNVNWLGNALLDITTSVENNEAIQYDGRIRVYVTEVESSMGWHDTTGHPYTFPFLDYAFNENISIASGGTWTDSINWDGHDYNDGYGHNFSTIQYGNIMIIAVVFNSEWHQGYAYPPSQNPFDAYYVDDATGFFVGDNPPYTPSDPDPANNSTDVDINKELSWTGGGPPGTTVTYDIYFGTTSNPPMVSSNQSNTTYHPGTMEYYTMYYWKIISRNNQGSSTEGPLWHFTTINNPNHPPSTPEISGQSHGKPGITYQFNIIAIDPENDHIYYFVEWGDGSYSEWLGPYVSGNTMRINHTWSKGIYTIKVKAKDNHSAESDWGLFQFNVPKIYGMREPSFLEKIFEQFPHAFPILRFLMGY